MPIHQEIVALPSVAKLDAVDGNRFASMQQSITVTFIEESGIERKHPATSGQTLMEAARDHGVAGIIAECGGAGLCGTCHVTVHADWLTRLPPRNDMEGDLLDGMLNSNERSRLACQITITPELDGLAVSVATGL